MTVANSSPTFIDASLPNRAVHALLLLIMLSLLAGCQSERAPSADTASTGGEIRRDYLGRWLVINYWAEWCGPCREEIPELNRLASHQPEHIAVVGINFDGITGAELDRAVEAMNIEFSSAGQDLAASYTYPPPRVLPTTIIIDPRGNVTHQLQGPQTYAGLLERVTHSPAASP